MSFACQVLSAPMQSKRVVHLVNSSKIETFKLKLDCQDGNLLF